MKHLNHHISPDLLSELFPLSYLTDNERELFCNKTQRLHAKPGQQLIQLGSTDDRALYLLKGQLTLEAKDGHAHTVTAGSEDSKRAISHLVPHWYTVTCGSHVEFFWIENFVLENLLQRQNRGGEHVQDLDVDSRLFKHKLFQRIYHDLSEDKLALPTLPEVLIHIQSLVEGQQQAEQLTWVISSDPALSATVVKIANSAVYRKSKLVDTVQDAVNLIGVERLKDILLKNITRSLHYSYSPEIITRVQAVWWHSAEVAAIAYAMAKLLKKFNPKRAMLMGLLHDIGMLPIYYYADRYPELVDKNQSLDDLVKQLHGDLGALILANWKFPTEFLKVSIDADDWHYRSEQDEDYSDLIMVAHLHSFIGKGEEKKLLAVSEEHLPAIIDLPAYHKLGLADLTPENSMWLLNTAKKKLDQLKDKWGLKESWGTNHWRKANTA
jgi:putative nucleotidyltransferase with HDIG domain